VFIGFGRGSKVREVVNPDDDIRVGIERVGAASQGSAVDISI
jgi:hypothetical protein